MDFDTAFARLINIEGGFSDDPKDRGNWTSGRIGVGELKGTKYGISAMSYPDLDIRNLTLEQAKAIYKRDFWDNMGGDQFDPALLYQLFDMAVNSGPQRARMALQRAVGVADDGQIGLITISAVVSKPLAEVIMLFNAERLDFYRSLSTWPEYGRGWAGRIVKNLRYGAEDA